MSAIEAVTTVVALTVNSRIARSRYTELYSLHDKALYRTCWPVADIDEILERRTGWRCRTKKASRIKLVTSAILTRRTVGKPFRWLLKRLRDFSSLSQIYSESEAQRANAFVMTGRLHMESILEALARLGNGRRTAR